MAWCHADVETTNRRPRVDRLIPPGNVATIGDWLEVLVTDPTVDGASAAIRAAAAVFPDAPLKRRREIASARIVLCSDGSVAAPNAVLISLPGRPRSPRNKYVDQALVDNAETHRALVEIGVRESDAVGDLRTFLARLRKEPRDDEWRTLWDLAGHVSAGDFVEALHANGFDDGRISALTLAGDFRPVSEVLLAGEIVDGLGDDDATVTVDARFHGATTLHLRRLGVVDSPSATGGSSTEAWFAAYQGWAQSAYVKRLRSDGQKLRKELATFEQVRGKDGSFAGPLDRLDFMSDQARARYTAAVLDMVSGDDASWTVVHATNPASFSAAPGCITRVVAPATGGSRHDFTRCSQDVHGRGPPVQGPRRIAPGGRLLAGAGRLPAAPIDP